MAFLLKMASDFNDVESSLGKIGHPMPAPLDGEYLVPISPDKVNRLGSIF